MSPSRSSKRATVAAIDLLAMSRYQRDEPQQSGLHYRFPKRCYLHMNVGLLSHIGRKPQVAALHAVVTEATAQLIGRKPLALVDHLPRAVLQCAEIIQYCLGAQTMRLRLLDGNQPVEKHCAQVFQ